MKTNTFFRALAAAALSALVAVVFVPVAASAAEIRTGNQPTVQGTETVNNDLYIAGNSVSSLGKVQGDLSAAGGSVIMTGAVSQNVLAAGGTVTLLGNVGGSVRIFGGNVTVSGTVGSDVVVAGGQIQILGSRIGRDVVAAGGSVHIVSPVAGNVRFAGGELYINAPITGNVEAYAKKVTLGSSAVISGSFTYKAEEPAVMEKGAVVSGTVTYTQWASKDKEARNAFWAIFTVSVVVKFLMLLVSALVFGLVFKRYVLGLVHEACKEPFAGLGTGLVTAIVLPIASLILLATVVGVPFGALGIISFGALLILSGLVAPVLMGSVIQKWAMKRSAHEISWKTILLGVAVYSVIALVPLLGFVVNAAFFLTTLGVIARMKWNLVKTFR